MGVIIKMGWYKFAKNFKERNLINAKIRYLSGLQETLLNISKVIFQSGKEAKSINQVIIGSKKITSYPILRDILINADSIALDSPWKFADFCIEAIDMIDQKLNDLKQERYDLIHDKKGKPMKGWVDLYG
jgi:hypothetical protein